MEFWLTLRLVLKFLCYAVSFLANLGGLYCISVAIFSYLLVQVYDFFQKREIQACK